MKARSLYLLSIPWRRGQYRGRLLNILQQRKVGNSLSAELRKLALDDITAAGGLEYTKNVILGLQNRLDRSLTQCEERAGESNWILRLMKKRLELWSWEKFFVNTVKDFNHTTWAWMAFFVDLQSPNSLIAFYLAQHTSGLCLKSNGNFSTSKPNNAKINCW